MTSFAETLQRCMWGKVGSQKLSNLTLVPKSKIDSWLQGRVQRPRDWRPILTIARVLLLNRDEADTLLLAAGHRSIGELAQRLAPEHPDRRYLQPWLAAAPLPPSARHQLRAPVGDFVGREVEVAQLKAALLRAADTGGVAAISGVQGMGGIGKTELAYVVADKLRGAFPDAQLVLALRGASLAPLPPEQALQAVIRTFSPDTKLPEDLSTLERLYCAQLHKKRVLILADDAHDAAQVRPLLPPAGCGLLITSRTRFTLPAMTTIDLEQLAAEQASRLLRSICPRLAEDEAQALARACGYLPLALRVAAGLLHTTPALAITQYLMHLADERKRLIHLHNPDDQQLDVEASLTLSYAQLNEATQQVFRQLGVLVADFATTLAQTVVAAPAGVDVEAALHRLLRRNLMLYDTERDRWRLHDLVRDLARSYLLASEEEAAMWRYARAAVQLAEETQEQYLAGGEGMLTALAQFDAERPHIDASRRWATEHLGTSEGDRLMVEHTMAMVHIGVLRYDTLNERIPQFECTLAAARRLGKPHAEGVALNHLGLAYARLGENRAAIHNYEQGLTIAQVIGDRRGETTTLNSLGGAYFNMGELQRAIHYYEQSLATARAIGEQRGEGMALTNLGNAYVELGEPQHAIPFYEQVLTIARAIGERRGEGHALCNLGNAYAKLGESRRAIEYCEEALAIARAFGDRRLERYTLSYLAGALARQGDMAKASNIYTQALTRFQEVSDRAGEAACRWDFGLALVRQGEREALPLLRAALAYEQEIGHARAAQHAALLARLEVGEPLPAELLDPASQRAVGVDGNARTDNDAPR